jgi:hypothetical protein
MSNPNSINMNFDTTSISDVHVQAAWDLKGKMASLILWLVPWIVQFVFRVYLLDAAAQMAVDYKRYMTPQRVVKLDRCRGSIGPPMGLPDNTPCSICWEAISFPQIAATHIQCKTPFHQDCLYPWLTKVGNPKAKCPLCQTLLVNAIEDVKLGNLRWDTKSLLALSLRASFVNVLIYLVLVLPTFGLARIEKRFIGSDLSSTFLKDFTSLHVHWTWLCLHLEATKLVLDIEAKIPIHWKHNVGQLIVWGCTLALYRKCLGSTQTIDGMWMYPVTVHTAGSWVGATVLVILGLLMRLYFYIWTMVRLQDANVLQ